MFNIKKNICRLILLISSTSSLFSTETFTPFQTEEEVQKNVNFLTSTSEKQGSGYVGTAGALDNRYLPLSYYSTPSYWG